MTTPRRPYRLATVFVVAAAGAGLGFAACGGAGDQASPPAPPMPTGVAARDAELLEGRTVYAKYCSACHGTAGSGGPGTAFTGGRLLRSLPTADEEAVVVRNGRAVMPSFGETLTPAQLDAVVRYTREVLATRPASKDS